jgi:hypothetical protein
MGDIGIDEWCSRMEEHKRKGHIKKFGERVKLTANEVAQELLLKDERAKFWERNRRIATVEELGFGT